MIDEAYKTSPNHLPPHHLLTFRENTGLEGPTSAAGFHGFWHMHTFISEPLSTDCCSQMPRALQESSSPRLRFIATLTNAMLSNGLDFIDLFLEYTSRPKKLFLNICE